MDDEDTEMIFLDGKVDVESLAFPDILSSEDTGYDSNGHSEPWSPVSSVGSSASYVPLY